MKLGISTIKLRKHFLNLRTFGHFLEGLQHSKPLRGYVGITRFWSPITLRSSQFSEGFSLLVGSLTAPTTLFT